MNKTPRFISLMADTTAKALIKDDHYRWFYEEVIKFKTGIDLKGYQLIVKFNIIITNNFKNKITNII